jgi:hypothetical protein
MSDFVLGVMSFLFADSVSAGCSAYIADDGCIVAALNRVDPIVVPTDIDLEKHDSFKGTTHAAPPSRLAWRFDDHLGRHKQCR